MKRITTALLVLLLVFSLSVTVWAEEPEPGDPVEISTAEQIISETSEAPESMTVPNEQEGLSDRELPQPSKENDTSADLKETESEKSGKKQSANEKAPAPTAEIPDVYPMLDKESSKEYAVFFRDYAGLNNAVIAGILANIQRESSFDPTSQGDSGNAFGLCQWNKLRQKRLDALCERAELNRDDVMTQEIFMIAELQVYYPAIWNQLLWLEETEEEAALAAEIFCKEYEKPAQMEEEKEIRSQLAKYYFSLLTY